MSTVTLSTGEVVHFKEKFTHGADKAWAKAFADGVYYEGEGSIGKVPTGNLALAYEAAMPFAIEKVVIGSSEQPCTVEWLEGITVKDYNDLYLEVVKMRKDAMSGKKKD